MKKINVQDFKRIQLNMLKYIINICEKYKLKYFLIAGTLLGAIRHKGYIPWDDDIDIGMPFDDYKKLIKIINEQNSKYYVLNPYENNDYYYLFSKMVDKETVLIEKNYKRIKDMGVFIDIFPLYKLPDDEIILKKYNEKLKKLEKVFFRNYILEKYYYSNSNIKSIIKKIIFFPEYIILKKQKNKKKDKILNILEKFEKKETNKNGFIMPPGSLKDAMENYIFKDNIIVEFEGIKVKAPVKYDKYLSKKFGNYMKLPPKEEQVAPHNFEVYYKE